MDFFFSFLKNRKALNVSSSLVQAFVSGICAILVSKFSFHFLGAGLLGFWAIILSISSFGAFLNSGICVAVIKFIAEKNVGDIDYDDIRKTIFSSLVISVFLTVIASFLIFIIYLIYFRFQPSYNNLSWQLYAFCAIVVFILTSLSNIILNYFDGFKLTYIKNFIIIGTTALYLAASYFFLKNFSLIGLVILLIVQNGLIIIIGLFALKKKEFFVLSVKYFDLNCAKELLKFSTKVQYITVVSIVLDPLTKGLLKHFGSYSNVGIYDMANRLVLQVRTIIVNLNQLLLPYFSAKSENSNQNNQYIYITIFKLILVPTILIFVSLIFFSKSFSIFWLKEYNKEFILYITLLSFSCMLNVLSTPSYYSKLGQGKLKELLNIHLIMGIINLALGVLLGYIFSAQGVVIAWAVALSISSIILMHQASNEYKFGFVDKIKKNEVIIITAIAFSIFPLAFSEFYNKNYNVVVIVFIVWFVMISYFYFKNNYKLYISKFK